jgi:SAM-dependent methyltransferase
VAALGRLPGLAHWRSPPRGFVRFGSLRRLSPVSRDFGWGRGTPLDRYYIADFLRRHAGVPGYAVGDIRGHVLEIGEDQYTREFGHSDKPDSYVDRVDVLHADEGIPAATIVGDLTAAEHIPSDSFDCVICTQTLQMIYDLTAAIRTIQRILKPGGVVLATVAGISQVSRLDDDLWGDYWRFTTRSARRLLE